MTRILALDVGDKTIGVAASDALGITAQGITTVRRENLAKDLATLKKLVAEYDADGRVISMTINTPFIDNDMLAGILPSDVVITSFDTNSSDATKQVNHFQGTSAQLKLVSPASNGRFEAFTNFDKQTSQFLGGSITIVTAP